MATYAPELLDSIKKLPAQLSDAWQQVASLEIHHLAGPHYHSIAVCGMGGSTLGADVIRHAFRDSLSVPLEIINDYKLPAWIDDRTLLILSSYSGNTEETLSAAREAQDRGCKIFVMGAGGKLIDIAQKHDWPFWQIKADENPSKQPRMAIGYMLSGLACLLSRLDLLDLNERKLESAGQVLLSQGKTLTENENAAETLAGYASSRFILLMSAEHLIGAAHVFNNQINENAKQLCIAQALPELDHHFLEGISFPYGAKKHALAILLQSDLYNLRNRKRVELTSKILEGNGIPSAVVDIFGPNRLSQALSAIQFGAFTSYYLAKKHGIDPVPVPNVEALKKALRR